MPVRLPMQPALVIDACVLMSGVLRPLLLDLADQHWFAPVWSDKIGNEWRRNAARIWDVPMPTLEQAWQAMEDAHPRANLSLPQNQLANWEPPTLVHSDPKDWHVIQTAAQARETHEETTIITWNLRDFRRSELNRLGLRLTDPDRFLLACWQAHGEDMLDQLEHTLQTLVDAGRRRPQPIAHMLAHERLFRLRKRLLAENRI